MRILRSMIAAAGVALAGPMLCGTALRAQLPDAPMPNAPPMLAANGAAPVRYKFLQAPPQAAAADIEAPAEDDSPTMFRHSDRTRWFLAGQANIVFQAHGPFHSPYQGTNSFLPRGEYKTSLLGTVYTGYQLNPNPRYATDAIFDYEAADGRGDSEALGIAGFTNLDVVRNPNLGKAPYLAQYMIHQVIGLTGERIDSERTTTSLATQLPVRRLEFWVGRMGLPDFLDSNAVGSDSHLQFLNWTADNNGAYDYAANTRGYTDGFVAEVVDGDVTAIYAIAAMPVVANGEDLQYQFRRGNGQNAEIDWRKSALAGRKGAVRLLGFVNRANMGDYRAQNRAFLAGLTPTPEIAAHPFTSSVKYGVGLNFEQEVSANGRVYGRFGWNEGQHESFAYTEVDQTFAVGGDYRLKAWHRPLDKLGLTFVSNAIKKDHQEYLKLGGLGFILGDGTLRYGRENIVEAYDNVHAWRGVYYALDLQYVDDPGYNRDRGPALVESVRMHVDF